MSLRDSWQFRSVLDYGAGSKRVPFLGENCSVSLESLPSVAGSTITDGLGNTLDTGEPGVVVSFGLPSDLEGAQLNGNVRILVSSNKFVRDPSAFDLTLTSLTPLEATLPLGLRDSVVYRHFIPAPQGTNVYVSLAYQESNGLWCFSPDNLFSRTLVRPELGEFGEKMYSSLPPSFRQADIDNDYALLKLIKILSASFDDANAQINQLKAAYDVANVDAGKLAYIDRIVGWPTHLLVNEDIRRLETLESVSIFKNKSTRGSIDYAMQQTIGWSAKIYDGSPWVLSTNFIQEQQPADWVEGLADPDSTLDPTAQATGIWEDSQQIGLTLWSPDDGAVSDSPVVGPSILPDFNSWKHPGGVLVSLTPTATKRTSLDSVARNRARSLALELVPHYVDVHLKVAEAYAESLDLALLDESDDDVFATSDNSISVEFSISHQASVGYCPFNTYPLGGDLNDSQDRLIHTALTYTCNQGGGGGGGGGEFTSP